MEKLIAEFPQNIAEAFTSALDNSFLKPSNAIQNIV